MEYARAARKMSVLEAAREGDQEHEPQISLPEGGEARKFKGKKQGLGKQL